MLVRKCLICNKEFKTYLALNKKLCGFKCAGIYHSQVMMGHKSGMTNKKHSLETIKKLKQIRNTKKWKDKVYTFGRNKKISLSHIGDKNPNWKGGSKIQKIIRNKIRKSFEYKNWRRSIFIRDEFICQECGTKNIYLEAHHIKSWKNYPDLRFDINNGITLCRSCHILTR